jgi:uncharacterized membrane protein
MSTRRILAVLAASLFLAGRGSAQSFDYITVDVPCSADLPTSCPNGVAVETVISGINARGEIVGTYVDGANRQHGFLRAGGRYTTIDVPGELVGLEDVQLPTAANGINARGDIVGTYRAPVNPGVTDVNSPAYCPAASAACTKGFLYSGGRFYAVLVPDHPGAIPQRVMPNGDIYGCLHDYDTGMSMFGAVWTRSGELSLMAGGGQLTDATLSIPMSMNNGATPDGALVAGLWTDASGRHGFIVQDGVFTSYDVPSPTIRLTAIWDMNPRGQFVGTYVDATGRHGFLQNPDGSAPIQLDVPGGSNPIAYGINAAGIIVGTYTFGNRSHGFIAVPSSAALQ